MPTAAKSKPTSSRPQRIGSGAAQLDTVRPARTRSHGRLLARGQLSLRRPDLSARQSAAPPPAHPRRHQAAPLGPLRHHPGAQLHLSPPQPHHPPPARQRHGRRRPRSRRSRHHRQHLSGRHLHRGLPRHRAQSRRPQASLPPVLLALRHPLAQRRKCPGIHPRGRRARLLAPPRLLALPSTTPISSSPASSATARPRPVPSPPPGTRTSSSTPSPTAPSFPSFTSTATRSRTPPSSPASSRTS